MLPTFLSLSLESYICPSRPHLIQSSMLSLFTNDESRLLVSFDEFVRRRGNKLQLKDRSRVRGDREVERGFEEELEG